MQFAAYEVVPFHDRMKLLLMYQALERQFAFQQSAGAGKQLR
jgi:hypothetical protein